MAEPYVRPFLFIAKAIILIFTFPGTVVAGSTQCHWLERSAAL